VAVRRLKRPRDPIQLSKLIVDIATGQIEEPEESTLAKRARVAGRKGERGRRLLRPSNARRLPERQRRRAGKRVKPPSLYPRAGAPPRHHGSRNNIGICGSSEFMAL
jgi:hypothetical protein